LRCIVPTGRTVDIGEPFVAEEREQRREALSKLLWSADAGADIAAIDVQHICDFDLSGVTVALPWRLVFAGEIVRKVSFSRFTVSSAASSGEALVSILDEPDGFAPVPRPEPQSCALRSHRLLMSSIAASVT
jgi:hypothetical protein